MNGAFLFRALPLRLLIGGLLLFGSEIMLWPDPLRRSWVEWLPVLAGYAALGAVVLDLAARYRARGMFGVLVLAGLYSLTAALTLNPDVLLDNVPQALVSRVLGAQTAETCFVVIVLLAMLRGKRNWLLVAFALVAGVVYGILGRWFPLAWRGVDETPLMTLMIAAVIGFALIAALWLWAARQGADLNADALKLSLPGWAVVGVILVALLAWRVLQGEVDTLSVSLSAGLIAFLWLILTYLRSKRGVTLLETALPPARPQAWFALPAVVFVIGEIIGYGLPRGQGDTDIITILGTLFITVGLVWLPSVSLVLGGRALMRQIRTQQL